MELRATGDNGQIVVDGKFVTITRKGYRAVVSQGFKGERRIPISSIMTVQFRPAKGSAILLGAMGAGYIQFGTLGGMESGRGAFAAYSDENSVSFSKKQQHPFEEIRDYIESVIGEREGGRSVAPPSLATELKDLAALRDAGILTDAEFESQKRKLLS